MSDDGYHRVRELDRGKYVGSDVGVLLHDVKFIGRQWPRLVQNELWYRQLAHVVEKSGSFDRSYLEVVIDADTFRQADRIALHSPNVAMCNLVLGINCHGESLNRREVHFVYVS